MFYQKYPNLKDCVIQVFDDVETRKDNNLAVIMPMTRTNLDKCVEYNKEWRGIYFSVNTMVYEWQAQRNKNIVWKINSWIVDIDTGSKEDQMKLIEEAPLLPSMIIESNKWYHLYYFAEDWDVETYSTINAGLCEYYHWDKKVIKDTARVLRIPWFYHMKDMEHPFEVKEIECNGAKYTKEMMMKYFPYVEEVKEIVQRKEIPVYENDWPWEILGKMDNRQMLLTLSGTRFLWWEMISFQDKSDGTSVIVCNWKPTGCWIDINGMIGTQDWKGCPTWIQWVEWYRNTDKAGILFWAKWVFPEVAEAVKRSAKKFQEEKKELSKLIEKDEQKMNDSRDVITEKRTIFTWGTKRADLELKRIENWNYVILAGLGNSGKTTYTFFMAEANARQGRKVLYLSYEMTREELIKSISRKFAKITDKEWEDWTDTEQQKEKYREKEKELRNNTNLILVGLHNDESTTKEATYEQMKIHNPDIVFIDNFARIYEPWINSTQNDEIKSKYFANLTNNTQIPIVIIHHVNIKTTTKNVFPKVQDVRGSGKIFDDCDIMVLCHRHKREPSDMSIGAEWETRTVQEMENESRFYLIQEKVRMWDVGFVFIYHKSGNFTDNHIS